MFSIDLSRYRVAFLLSLGLACPCFVGCTEKSVDTGVERNASNPVKRFTRDDYLNATKNVSVAEDQRFLSKDEVLVAHINVEKLRKMLPNVTLDDSQNMKLPNDFKFPTELFQATKDAWLLFDLSFFEASEKLVAEKQAPPVTGSLFVFNLTEELQSGSGSGLELPDNWAESQTSTNQILLGEKAKLERVSDNKGSHTKFPVSSEIWNSNAELAVALDFAKLYPRIEQLMAGRFGGDSQSASLLETMETTELIYAYVDLTSPSDLLTITANTSDEESAKLMVQKVSEAIDQFRTFIGFISSQVANEDTPDSKEIKKTVRFLLAPVFNGHRGRKKLGASQTKTSSKFRNAPSDTQPHLPSRLGYKTRRRSPFFKVSLAGG